MATTAKRAKSRGARFARLEQTLVYYDGPQVVLLKSSRSFDMLAVATEREDLTYAFFACEIKPATLRKYLADRIDLNYVFKFADYGRYYFFDWQELEDGQVELIAASDAEIADDANYPEPGFFARDHSHPVSTTTDQARQTFAIDGKWEASDFSRFYSKISDIYAFLFVVGQIRDGEIKQVDLGYVKNTISSYFWQGGGSYVGFYDNIFERVGLYNPLDVRKISYASPGTIELEGKKEIFLDIKNLFDKFETSFFETREIYKSLRANLKGQNLLAAERSVRLSKRLAESLKEQSDKLAKALNIADPSEVLSLCDGNELVYAKVVLSLFRRARDLYLFHAEGRVQLRGDAVDAL
ncbi:hypothetical protein [Bradyrhizobium ottawaense]|uniref:hypothetical protein n=1 Tax=Bradyrhizobium ottawaense TaxID=931866 RepID=UPI0027FF7A91|nr:hypothetical protein BwSF21_56260 [Bradyrhizobium ottawaense]